MKYLLLLLISILTTFNDQQPYKKIIKSWCKLFSTNVKYYSRFSDTFSVDLLENVMHISKYSKSKHDPYQYVCSVAHEIGHLLDLAYREQTYDDPDEIFISYTEDQETYQEEIRAWSIAKVLLQDAKIYDEKPFNAFVNKNLKDYRSVLNLGGKNDQKLPSSRRKDT